MSCKSLDVDVVRTCSLYSEPALKQCAPIKACRNLQTTDTCCHTKVKHRTLHLLRVIEQPVLKRALFRLIWNGRRAHRNLFSCLH